MVFNPRWPTGSSLERAQGGKEVWHQIHCKELNVVPYEIALYTTQKDWEVIIDLGVKRSTLSTPFPRKYLPWQSLQPRTSMESTHDCRSERTSTRHKPKASATTTKKRRRPGPKPLAKAEPPAPPKPRWRPMSRCFWQTTRMRRRFVESLHRQRR